MNYSFNKKSIFKLPDDANCSPFKIIKHFYFIYSNSHEIKCINMNTSKTNLVLEINEGLAEPYFGLVNELKLIVKPTESKIELYQINKLLFSFFSIFISKGGVM